MRFRAFRSIGGVNAIERGIHVYRKPAKLLYKESVIISGAERVASLFEPKMMLDVCKLFAEEGQ